LTARLKANVVKETMKTIRGTLNAGKTAPLPDVECYLPSVESSGIGIVIFPGGGYGNLATHEGRDYAKFFSRVGIACFVTKYRLGSAGHRHPEMLEDALAAISTVKSRAKEFAINPEKLGVMGSSAGGHLAAHSLVAWQQYQREVSLRPRFGILCYPVIASQGPYAHAGSMANLAGDNPSPELLDALSCDKHVSAETPPCFLWHTGEDTGVPLENSILFATALRKHSIPFELHLYHKGGHGLGLGAPFDWAHECLRWIEETAQPSVALRSGDPRA
jgi:acetyl esterase/lipase